MIKMSSRGGGVGVQGAESIGKGFIMIWSKDREKFKMAAIFIWANYIFIHAALNHYHM